MAESSNYQMPVNGLLHQVPRTSIGPDGVKPAITVFEHATDSTAATNSLIFLQGLFDGPLTVPYTRALAAALPPQWRLVEPILSSSYRQFGFSNLGADVAEVMDVVRYWKGKSSEGRVVLMGHSTGCQIAMHYALHAIEATDRMQTQSEVSAEVAGIILQAPVSDREAMSLFMPVTKSDEVCIVAREYMENGKGNDILPSALTSAAFQSAPVCASRWLSLLSPGPDHAGEDDYFSSDFDDERIARSFGKLGQGCKRICIFISGADQYMPQSIEKTRLLERWRQRCEQGGCAVDSESRIVDGASHNVQEGGAPCKVLVTSIVHFLKTIDNEA